MIPKKPLKWLDEGQFILGSQHAIQNRATCALTVTASGKMITPLFVFKGNN